MITLLQTHIVCPTIMNFDWSNSEIGLKMANSQLLVHTLGIALQQTQKVISFLLCTVICFIFVVKRRLQHGDATCLHFNLVFAFVLIKLYM